MLSLLPTQAKRLTALCLSLMVLSIPSVARPNALYGPSAYLSSADSPFASTSFQDFHLEDFEDGALNTPGVLAVGGFALPAGPFSDSVDADDGLLDGSGAGSGSFYSGNSNGVSFVFDANALGALPTHVGMVWTDVGFSSAGLGVGDFLFEAFDAANVLIASIGSARLGDGLFGGQTGEDRFFGIASETGIASIRVSMSTSSDWEMDHLQYGLQATRVPEPPTLALAATAAILALFGGRRRRSRQIGR